MFVAIETSNSEDDLKCLKQVEGLVGTTTTFSLLHSVVPSQDEIQSSGGDERQVKLQRLAHFVFLQTVQWI